MAATPRPRPATEPHSENEVALLLSVRGGQITVERESWGGAGAGGQFRREKSARWLFGFIRKYVAFTSILQIRRAFGLHSAWEEDLKPAGISGDQFSHSSTPLFEDTSATRAAAARS